jgi:hypothetical protein
MQKNDIKQSFSCAAIVVSPRQSRDRQQSCPRLNARIPRNRCMIERRLTGSLSRSFARKKARSAGQKLTAERTLPG